MNEHQQVSKALLQKNYLDPNPKEPSGPSGSHSKRTIWSIWVPIQKNHLVHLDPTPKEPSGPSGSQSKRTIWSIWISLKEYHLVHLGPIIQLTNCAVVQIVISITINVYTLQCCCPEDISDDDKVQTASNLHASLNLGDLHAEVFNVFLQKQHLLNEFHVSIKTRLQTDILLNSFSCRRPSKQSEKSNIESNYRNTNHIKTFPT